jgi:DNA polymerase III epsilon subunit-like protein
MPISLDRFVAVDVEIASLSPLRVCAIGAVRCEHGCETGAYRSLVAAEGRIRFSHIHGIWAADLEGPPAWPVVWQELMAVLGDIRTLVAFRASFDRGAILTMSARHAIRLPRLQFVCAAAMVEARYGTGLDLTESLGALGISFPGHPHDPLADARAAAMIAQACTASPTPSVRR